MTRLNIYLLDSFRATLDAKPIAFEYDKVRALLAYLVMESDRPIHREKLATFLWSECTQDAASIGLRQALSKLRKALSSTDENFLLIQGDTIQFNTCSDVWVDAWAFAQVLKEAADHHHRRIQTCSTCAHLMIQACELYKDDFLAWLFIPDSSAFEEWATIQRVRLRTQASESLLHITAYYSSLGDYTQVQVFVDRLLALDPLNEEAHCQKMIALASLGKRSQAIAYFKTFSRQLRDELGLSPSDETLDLVHSIQSGIPIGKPDVENLILSGISLPEKPIVGREVEQAEMQEWLESPDRRLITMSGPGGIGKTRLALEVALSQKASFTHGVVLINLLHFNSTDSFIPAVLDALHFSGTDSQDSELLLCDYFRKKEVLLILDSFDNVINSKSALQRLLECAPRLVVLVTSRVHLNLPEEWIFDLGGLEVPPITVDNEIDVYSAVSLFVQSAKHVKRGFALSPEDRQWVGKICRLVQGMPLAIVLAAPWIRVLSCEEIAHEIQTNLDFLSATGENINHHNTSMRAVFDQSWSMLNEEEQRVLRQLSVFHGGFDRMSAEEVAGASLNNLANLVDQSLLANIYEGRYDSHDLLRQYAYEKLVDAGEMDQTVRNFTLYFLQMAELKENLLRTNEKLLAFTWFIREQSNLLAALQYANNEKLFSNTETSQHLASLLHQDWHRYGVHMWNASV